MWKATIYSYQLTNCKPLNPCIFRETKFRDRKFPDRTLQEGTFGDQKIPGIPICHGIWEIIFGENSRILFWTGQKIPGFLTQLNSRSENSLTEFSKTFNLSRTVDLEVFLKRVPASLKCIVLPSFHPNSSKMDFSALGAAIQAENVIHFPNIALPLCNK